MPVFATVLDRARRLRHYQGASKEEVQRLVDADIGEHVTLEWKEGGDETPPSPC